MTDWLTDRKIDTHTDRKTGKQTRKDGQTDTDKGKVIFWILVKERTAKE